MKTDRERVPRQGVSFRANLYEGLRPDAPFRVAESGDVAVHRWAKSPLHLGKEGGGQEDDHPKTGVSQVAKPACRSISNGERTSC